MASYQGKEKCLESNLEARFGVSICFFGLLWRGRNAETLVLLGLARPEGFEPPTHCFEGSCSIP